MTEAADSFSRFLRTYWRRLHLVACRYTQRGEDAEDLVQETALRAWRHYAPRSDQSFRAGWLFTILRRVASEWARTAQRRITLVPVDHEELTEMAPSDLTEPFAPLPSTTESRFREFLDDEIVAALDALEPNYREVVVLAVVGDLNYREIAEVLDCPIGTVMSRMARARRALRDRLSGVAKAKGWRTETVR